MSKKQNGDALNYFISRKFIWNYRLPAVKNSDIKLIFNVLKLVLIWSE